MSVIGTNGQPLVPTLKCSGPDHCGTFKAAATPPRAPSPARRKATLIGSVSVGSFVAVTISGCSSLPQLPSVDLSTSRQIAGSPTEHYTRIARGALTCWFGPGGPLRGGYLYQAEAEPASRGGRSEITVHERETDGQNPRGVKAYQIVITPDGEQSQVDVTNLKLSENLDRQLRSDVDRWMAGEVGCVQPGKGPDWIPYDPNAVKPSPAPKKAPPPAKSRKPAKSA